MDVAEGDSIDKTSLRVAKDKNAVSASTVSFLALKRSTRCFRSTMGDHRVNNLMMVQVHRLKYNLKMAADTETRNFAISMNEGFHNKHNLPWFVHQWHSGLEFFPLWLPAQWFS